MKKPFKCLEISLILVLGLLSIYACTNPPASPPDPVPQQAPNPKAAPPIHPFFGEADQTIKRRTIYTLFNYSSGPLQQFSSCYLFDMPFSDSSRLDSGIVSPFERRWVPYHFQFDTLNLEGIFVKQSSICFLINPDLGPMMGDLEGAIAMDGGHYVFSNPEQGPTRDSFYKQTDLYKFSFLTSHKKLLQMEFGGQKLNWVDICKRFRPLRTIPFGLQLARVDEIADSLWLCQFLLHGTSDENPGISKLQHSRVIGIYHKPSKQWCFLPSHEPLEFPAERVDDYFGQGKLQVLALDSLYHSGSVKYEVLRLFDIVWTAKQGLRLVPSPYYLHLYTSTSDSSYKTRFPFQEKFWMAMPPADFWILIDPLRSNWHKPIPDESQQRQWPSVLGPYHLIADYYNY